MRPLAREVVCSWRPISGNFVCLLEKVLFTLVFILLTSSSSQSADLNYNHNHNQKSNANYQFYAANESASNQLANTNHSSQLHLKASESMVCSEGLLTFELSTGYIYKPASSETLAMMPSTLQLTDCLDYCLQNDTCLAINFEMGLCVLLSSSAKQNPSNLYSSQFPVFTIYAEKKCLLAGNPQAGKQRRRCQRAWTFERVAGYEMKSRPRRRLKLATKELCMEACLTERDFECRSANWYRVGAECTLSDQDRHSVSQSEAGDQQIKASLHELYGPSNATIAPPPAESATPTSSSRRPALTSLYQNYYGRSNDNDDEGQTNKWRRIKQLFNDFHPNRRPTTFQNESEPLARQDWPAGSGAIIDNSATVNSVVDYLENNCVYEPNKLCEFRKIQNRVLKTVDSIYQDVGSVDECKQKCLNAPYRCYSFDYGDTSERVCRTSHLDQASLLSVKEPYLDVVGAITYELAACFNVSIHCRAREMVAQVSSSKMFKGKIYVKSRPNTCVNDVKEALNFELSMRYHDDNCDVHASSTLQQGVFSNDIVIQHHDRIVTTQDVGLSVYCQYDLGNRSITNNVDLAIERIDEPNPPLESKTQPGRPETSGSGSASGSIHSPLTITSLATTVVRSPNVTMRITNMNGQPVASATVGDRLALLFEIKEKTSPFGIFVREIIAMDGRQVIQQQQQTNGGKGYHYAANNSLLENAPVNAGNSIQFIDSQGCPTDANIMGPLVKMDPAGHRVLAPFDAFKFPTSDMVFFRAVVTSCISECKPVLCSPSSPIESPDYIQQSARAPALGNTPIPGELLPPASTSRLMPATRPTGTPTLANNTESGYGRFTTQPALEQQWQLTDNLLDFARPNKTKLPEAVRAQQKVGVASDSLTTVPGFGPPEAWTSSSSELPLISNPIPALTNFSLINKAKLQPKPEGNKISVKQAQQLYQVIMTKLSQLQKEMGNNGSFAEISSFYNKFADSILSDELLTDSSVASEGQQNAILAGNEANDRRKVYEKVITHMLHFADSGTQLSASELSDLKSFMLSRLPAYMSREYPVKDKSISKLEQQSRYTELVKRLFEQPKSILSNWTTTPRLTEQQDADQLEMSATTNSIDRGHYLHNYTDLSTATTTTAQQSFDQTGNALISADQQAKIRSQQQKQNPLGNNRMTKNSLLQNQEHNKQQEASNRKRLKANQLALAESPYLGAYQSFGRRRRRRQADAEPSSGYAVCEEPQSATVAPSLALGGAKFTRGLVEMYHVGKQRFKRHSEEPAYDLEELVVQSIKIVDRLQFADEEEEEEPIDRKQSSNRANNLRIPKKPLVTGGSDSRFSVTNLTDPLEQMLSFQGDLDRTAHEPDTPLRWSTWGALGLTIVALSLLFVQIFLVALWLMDWRGFSMKQFRSTSGRNARQHDLYSSKSILQDSRCNSVSSLSSIAICQPTYEDAQLASKQLNRAYSQQVNHLTSNRALADQHYLQSGSGKVIRLATSGSIYSTLQQQQQQTSNGQSNTKHRNQRNKQEESFQNVSQNGARFNNNDRCIACLLPNHL